MKNLIPRYLPLLFLVLIPPTATAQTYTTNTSYVTNVSFTTNTTAWTASFSISPGNINTAISSGVTITTTNVASSISVTIQGAAQMGFLSTTYYDGVTSFFLIDTNSMAATPTNTVFMFSSMYYQNNDFYVSGTESNSFSTSNVVAGSYRLAGDRTSSPQNQPASVTETYNLYGNYSVVYPATNITTNTIITTNIETPISTPTPTPTPSPAPDYSSSINTLNNEVASLNNTINANATKATQQAWTAGLIGVGSAITVGGVVYVLTADPSIDLSEISGSDQLQPGDILITDPSAPLSPAR